MAPTSDFVDALPGPEWLREKRKAAAATLDTASKPSSESEIWRYSRIDDLDLDRYQPVAPDQPPSGADPDSTVVDLIDAVGERAALVLTWNGSIVRVDIDDGYSAKGLQVRGPDTWTDGRGFASVAGAADLFAQMNTAFCPDPLIVDVPAGVVVDRPVMIVHWLADDGVVSFPRVVVRGGESSELSVVECFASADVDAFAAPVTEIDVAQAANINYTAIQAQNSRVWHVAYQASRVERDATLRSTTVALGGSYARTRTDSALAGTGATAKLNAVYFGSDSQMHDFRTLQDHRAPKTTSDLLFKGAVGDAARSVYSGLIRVEKGAAGTNAFQTNRNLVLSDGAHADSVPNLEIEENDVRCSHASAVGPIDEEQRYYLESRGVPSEIAERLIVLGFLDEIIAGLPVKGLRTTLRNIVARKLDELDGNK